MRLEGDPAQLCGRVGPREPLERGVPRVLCPDWQTRWSIELLPAGAEVCAGGSPELVCSHACHRAPEQRGPGRVTIGAGAR